ncbi:alpha/beta hydrolase [Flavobacterium muglaense]|uniref:Alpha/beta hydrolase n=1 Tax=Flavobacterium muglaense TaxID=2764716 RepID=A0A923N2T2_9FLAO|nr:alpha/beta hydrolase-fold protein [Flavobacterium muglaense]MBC5839755.1 alpha/beta hydrolase [Flavobacterium muglaense]MBC5846279.1 alpha/beta hydrolase [Flavobacterium muglaense]
MRKTIILFSILISIIGNAQVRKQNETSKPFLLGTIEEIDSKILSEKRILNIYLPEGYNQNDTIKYPVTYLLDGSADEDFIHVVGLFQFNNFSWINRVPKSIVVGIANIDRRRDFTYPTTIEEDKKRDPTSGKSANFISFIETELQPFIEKKYKTNNSKTLIGQSAGGLLATEILIKKSKLFNKYIIISPSLWWDNCSLLNVESPIYQESFKEKIDIYIGVGKEGLAPTEIPHVMEVDANLLSEKLKNTKCKNIKVSFDYLPEEDHATITHQAIFNAMRILYPKEK